MAMGKTETIKKRRVDVYLRSEPQKVRWNKYAKGQKMSLSKLVIDTVEARISGDLQNQLEIKETLTKQIKDLMNENETYKTQNKRLENYIDILEREMNRKTSISFSDPGPGFSHYNKELIDVLRGSNGPITNMDLLGRIRVDPSDTDVVKGISKQLEALTEYGLTKLGNRGWMWIAQR